MIALVCLCLFTGGGARCGSWPAIAIDPVPEGVVAEAVDPEASVSLEETRRSLLELLGSGDLPPPPAEPARPLVSWLVLLLPSAERDELDRFVSSADPGLWSPVDPDGRLPLPLALALQEAGRIREALAWLDRGAPDEEEALYRSLLRIELLESLGDSIRVLDEARGVRAAFPRSNLTLPAARILLDAAEKGRDHEGLIRQSLVVRRTLGPGAEETAARFRALQELGRAPAARAVGDTLLDLHPWGRTALREALRRLEEEEGWKTLEREARLLLGALLRHQRFAETERILAAYPVADEMKLLYLERLYELRRYPEILSENLTLSGSAAGDRARWLLLHARAARNSLQREPMERYYRAAASLGGSTRTTALLEWGREAESEQREGAADSIYTLLLAVAGQEEEARFRRALARYAAGRFEEALADLDALARPVGNGGAPFWRFRLAELLGDSAQARQALEEASGGEGYYGSRARLEIARRAGGRPRIGFWEAEREKATSPGESGGGGPAVSCEHGGPPARRAARIDLFRRFGRNEWADRERSLLESELPADRRAERFLCLGLPDLAIRVAIATGSPSPFLRYPRPFGRLIDTQARRVGIAPELVWAVARRESLFDPGAVSTAGAVGLLQLMESTARETAARWGLEAGPLSRPDRNVPLGVCHLRDLFDRFDWSLPALLAAYNAGVAKGTEWAERFPDPDLLIERIGWKETRAYVRHLLEGWWKYRTAYLRSGEGDPDGMPGSPGSGGSGG